MAGVLPVTMPPALFLCQLQIEVCQQSFSGSTGEKHMGVTTQTLCRFLTTPGAPMSRASHLCRSLLFALSAPAKTQKDRFQGPLFVDKDFVFRVRVTCLLQVKDAGQNYISAVIDCVCLCVCALLFTKKNGLLIYPNLMT